MNDMTSMKKILTATFVSAALLTGCSDLKTDDITEIPPATSDRLYILNEGQMGMNNSSLDFYDFTGGTYTSDAFASANPDVALGLGDTGNDISVHDGRLWIVVNGSNLVEVMDAATLEHIAAIDIPSGRDITFSNGYAYVTSWAGAYFGGEKRPGAVYRINTEDLSVSEPVDVGYQPEGIAVIDGKIYVANSGGVTDGYDNRLSILDEESFTLERNVEIASNICDIAVDSQGRLWISSPGDYYSTHSGIYIYDTGSGTVGNTGDGKAANTGPEWLKDIRVSSMYSTGDRIWVIGNENEWDYTPGSGKYVLYVIDTRQMTVGRTSLSDTDAARAVVPYGIWVSDDSRNIFIADAGDYINPGSVFMLDSELNLVGTFQAGVNPGHFAFFTASAASGNTLPSGIRKF